MVQQARLSKPAGLSEEGLMELEAALRESRGFFAVGYNPTFAMLGSARTGREVTLE
jgi:predicted dehydrogenase